MGGRDPTCADGGSDMMAGGVSIDGDGDNMIPAGKKINHIILCRVQKGGGDKYPPNIGVGTTGKCSHR